LTQDSEELRGWEADGLKAYSTFCSSLTRGQGCHRIFLM
jgi:hypothetical protein